MISWADPDLISKKEWDREYAQPIMAGEAGPSLSLFEGMPASLFLLGCAAARECASAPMLLFHSAVSAFAVAGQLPDASAHEIKTMNRRLAVFHDLTSGQAKGV